MNFGGCAQLARRTEAARISGHVCLALEMSGTLVSGDFLATTTRDASLTSEQTMERHYKRCSVFAQGLPGTSSEVTVGEERSERTIFLFLLRMLPALS